MAPPDAPRAIPSEKTVGDSPQRDLNNRQRGKGQPLQGESAVAVPLIGLDRPDWSPTFVIDSYARGVLGWKFRRPMTTDGIGRYQPGNNLLANLLATVRGSRICRG